jgi:preprotein translocase subunit SecD
VKRTRGLWASIGFVTALVVLSLVGFATGALKPVLGLDLEGGVSVILTAPAGTPRDVMEQTLGNIRNRVDAFGVGEPEILLSGNTIEIQIPGLAKGTIEERQKEQYCLTAPDGTNYGCAKGQAPAQAALDTLVVESQPSEVCLVDPDGAQLACFGSRQEAQAAKATLQVAPKASATPSGSASPSTAADGSYCLTDPTGAELACYPTNKAATAAQAGITLDITQQSFCVTDAGGAAAAASPSASPSAGASTSPGASASASASPAPTSSAYADLDRSGASALPCGLGTRAEANTQLADIAVQQTSVQYCVISSADQNLGCFLTKEAAQRRQRETGQERLLSVIGQTARLEQRAVIEIIDPTNPAYATTPVTCPTPEDRATKACSFNSLQDKEVVYLGQSNDPTTALKYRLGPVIISGGDMKKATAVLSGGSQTQIATQWTVQFELNGGGADAFGQATTKAVSQPPPQNQIAIVVDRVIISAPVVQSPITGGTGVITGGFSEQESKDLATQLNAGALPVELTRQSVQTVSPTLGQASLHQGIVAGLVGLALLFLYLLFYYRLLGIVAWFGMSIWAILAIALISVAGQQFSYALTLAGVAGLVISLGVTADSYIVFFERLKDEVRSGKSARSAVQPAFKRAYKTIVAADIVTGIAALVLYVTAVSSVKGFALTLGVATLLDLFVVWFFKRPTVFLIARNERLVNLKGFGLQSGIAGSESSGPERSDRR